jgi:hypothetical protein
MPDFIIPKNPAIEEMHATLGLGKKNQSAPSNRSEKVRFEFSPREFARRRREIWEHTFHAAVQGQFSNPTGARADSILVAMENADATVEVWNMRVEIKSPWWTRMLDAIFGSSDAARLDAIRRGERP